MAIGRDCVGALQFLPEDETPNDATSTESQPLGPAQIGRMLRDLGHHPLGMYRDQAFRISVAGAQEKTALVCDDGWRLPLGLTATTHILKTRTGQLQSGIDMSSNLANEFLCLKLVRAFGFQVNNAWIEHFDGIDALVVERFDRTVSGNRRLRLPQEDFCQALGVASVGKYEHDGGPGIARCLDLLAVSLRSIEDRASFLTAQIFFWMIGATDGHTKNFSIFLGPDGYRMTPLCDILSAEPARASGQIRHQQMQLAMAVSGTQRRYRIDQIHPRHFVQTAQAAGLGQAVIDRAFAQFNVTGVFDAVEEALPSDFSKYVTGPILTAARHRLAQINSFSKW